MTQINPQSLLIARFDELAHSEGDRIVACRVDRHYSLSYRELAVISHLWSARLAAHGIRVGDRVAIMSSDPVAFLGTFLGALRLGAVVIPLGVELRGGSLAHPLTLLEPSVLVVEPDLAAVAEAVTAGLTHAPTVLGIDLLESEAVAAVPGAEVFAAHASDPCMIMCTSGTTGPSKGSLWTHGTLWQWARTYVAQLHYTSADRIYCCTPLSHANALVAGFCTAVHAGGSIAISDRFTVGGFWTHITESGSTSANLLGAMIQLLLQADADEQARESGLRTMLVSACTATAHRKIRGRWQIPPVSAYGLTDFGTLTISAPDEPCPPGSCGRVADGFELAIVDPDGVPMPDGEAGELVARPTLASITPVGYYGMPEATLAARRDLWFHTGDLLRRTEDGWFYFAGRIKEALRYRGENVSAYEVEKALLETGFVAEAAVYAVPSPLGEDEIAAAIVLREDSTGVEVEEIVVAISRELPHFAVPRYVRTMTELPKNGSQRVVKAPLIEDGLVDDVWDRVEAGVQILRNKARV